MIEHPVPQNVTGYQFHLVGDMTLKQFLELAGGVILAWFFWTLNVPLPVKLVLSVASALFGFALAFMPLEDRPLDQWVIAFFKAIYHPTLFRWKKSAREDILRFQPRPTEKQSPLDAAAKAPAAGLQSLLQMYELQASEVGGQDPLEKEWMERQAQIPLLFGQVQVPRKLTQETTFPKQIAAGPIHPETKVFIHSLSPPENLGAILRGEITLSSRQPRASILETPFEEEPQIHREQTTGFPAEDAQKISGGLPSIQSTTASSQTIAATTNSSLLPTMPNSPNILAGMVFGREGRVAEGAIVEIRDQDGLPVRALKTNKLGQFAIATPLPNGIYEVESEKEGIAFDILKIEAKGEIMPPIEIRAK